KTVEAANAVIEADKPESEMEGMAPQQIHIAVSIDILRQEQGVFAEGEYKLHDGEGAATAQREGGLLLETVALVQNRIGNTVPIEIDRQRSDREELWGRASLPCSGGERSKREESAKQKGRKRDLLPEPSGEHNESTLVFFLSFARQGQLLYRDA